MLYDGELVEVVETAATAAGNEVVLKDRLSRLLRVSVRELLFSDRVQFVSDGPGSSSADNMDLASVVLSQLGLEERRQLLERAEHVREVLYGYRSGSRELAGEGEPRPGYDPALPRMVRYQTKADELGVSVRTIGRWVARLESGGEAALATSMLTKSVLDRCDPRWVEAAIEVMVEYVDQATPMRKTVIDRTRARLIARFGEEAVTVPSKSKAYEALALLEKQHPTFRLSTKRNRDIAGRPKEAYGRLRATRPGEYVLMDTTRLDVFALDPLTLRWVNCELTVAMCWYTRCIVGMRLTPVSTKAVDAASVLYQAYRPLPVLPSWPAEAVWPEHGIPRSVLVDPRAIEGPIARAAGPALAPETIVIDHGKIYVSDHLTSVCARMGISIQPVRLRTGRDKGPIERFFRTLRQDLLYGLPGYKGPDIFSRGVDPEGEAFFFLDELANKIRQWIAACYHHKPHRSLVEPGVPGLRMSPAQMFAHGMARAGYIEVPRDPHLGLEFLETSWRTIQPYGVEIGGCRYDGAGLPKDGRPSPYPNGLWPFQVNPDDITHVYFRDQDRRWRVLHWEHAPVLNMPMSRDALRYGRALAAKQYRHPNDLLVTADLFERWNLGFGQTLAERRMALRMARDQAAFVIDIEDDKPVAEDSGPPAQEIGDHDAADFEDFDGGTDLDEDAFYADALEDL
ncbi:transposase [Streptomyces sp. NBC_01142]|uniref:transposase n=1 Tax=Streptomyces sp. NBC_01142 TaxID=2975865 RepID=UPI002253DD35|nr:transposase [Streptomyces sp. NBC_01142]MCX4826119.1 transposase [Streptomyces sp. NBC_01142]